MNEHRSKSLCGTHDEPEDDGSSYDERTKDEVDICTPFSLDGSTTPRSLSKHVEGKQLAEIRRPEMERIRVRSNSW